MTIPVQDIIDRVTDLLFDKDRGNDEARWSDAELLRWVNDSRAAILTRRPQACAVIETVALVAGTKQTLPAGFQSAEFLLKHGLIDQIVSRLEMRSHLAGVLSALYLKRKPQRPSS